MKKNILAIILIILGLCLISVGIFMSFNDKSDNGNSKNNNGSDPKDVALNLLVEYNGMDSSSFEYVSHDGEVYKFILVESKGKDIEVYYLIDIKTKKMKKTNVSISSNDDVIDDDDIDDLDEVVPEIDEDEIIDTTIPSDVRDKNN